MKVVMGQLNTWVGDLQGNTDKVIKTALAVEQQEEPIMLVFPELTLTGYPPEDLLMRESLHDQIEVALQRLASELPSELYVVVGYPRRVDEQLFNAAGVIHGGALVGEYFKQRLPNYQVFDEKRYFAEGVEACVVDVAGIKVGITICEDIWHKEPADAAANLGAEFLINLNASPFHRGKHKERWQVLAQRATEQNIPMVYVNQVGGQDELVFDGGSFAVNANGELAMVAPDFEEGTYELSVSQTVRGVEISQGVAASALSDTAAVWQALVLGVRDYVEKNGFPGVVLGLSGGIDSAVTLAVAVDALGADRVQAVMMPFKYTADMSVEDAGEQAATMGVEYDVISIERIYEMFMSGLSGQFEGTKTDTTEENLQARCRGVLLMSISNKKHRLVLTTG
jgi:NAD+ synthase (glutamine-hydrolysing)